MTTTDLTDAARRLIELGEKATARPWFGPRITDDFPPGWVGIYEADEDGPIPGAKLFITGRHDDPESLANCGYIVAAANDGPRLAEAFLKQAAELVAARERIAELEQRLEDIESYALERDTLT